MSSSRILWIALVASFVLAEGSLAHADAIPEALRACGAEKNDALRLACFDRELAEADKSAPVPQPAAAVLTPEQRFGREGSVVRTENKREEKTRAPAIKELTATVVSLGARSYGEIVMRLDNGQVWAQQAVDSRFSIAAGEKVTIKAGVLGSFTAIAPNGRNTRVVRLK